jgi:hypothetical protein
MSDSLKAYANYCDSYDATGDELRITIGKQTFPINPHFDGETCWERNHPTFISKKRKVILTCPRKVGHSSIRFYLNSQNQMFDDDWIWIEDQNRDPKTWLTDEEYLEFVTSMWQPNKRLILHSYDKDTMPKHWVHAEDGSYNPLTKNAKLLKRGTPEAYEWVGDKCAWDNGMKVSPSSYAEGRDSEMTPPLQCIDFFKDWTSYLLVRDPWERFISGLITEMDNGMSCPWIYDREVNTQEDWEKYYNSAKRMLYFSQPDRLMVGGLDGQQMNHTFILARPLWEGKSMYDSYDNLIHYKHDIEYQESGLGYLHPTEKSMKETAGAIDTLINLDFIKDEVRVKHQEGQYQNMYAHTHINVTPEIRQRVIAELQEDEDLKEFWDICREYVQMDLDALKNNQSKFLKT